MAARRQPRLPIAPLRARMARIAESSGISINEQLNAAGSVSRRAFHRGSESGSMTVISADRLAVELLRVHPSAIWDGWFAA